MTLILAEEVSLDQKKTPAGMTACTAREIETVQNVR